MIGDKEFSFSVTPEGDSVVQEGEISDGTRSSKYFGEYEEALEYLREECLKLVKE